MRYTVKGNVVRRVTFEDADGRMTVRLVPDDAPSSHARLGVIVGPPDLSLLNLPIDLEVRLNNELLNRGLLTKKDLKGRDVELRNALNTALRLDVQNLMACYAEGEN